MSNNSYNMVMGAIVRSKQNEEFWQQRDRRFFLKQWKRHMGMDGEHLAE